MAIQVQVQSKADVEAELQAQARAKALAINKEKADVSPVVNPLDDLALGQPDATEESVISAEVEPNQTPALSDPDDSIRKGVPKEVLDKRKQMNEQRDLYKAQQQRDRERVKPLSAQEGWDNYQTETADAFGQAIDRASKFNTLFHDKLPNGASINGVWLDKGAVDTISGFDVNVTDIANNKGEPISKFSPKGILFDKYGFNAGQINNNGQMVVDPEFSKVMGLVTEDSFSNADVDQEANEFTEPAGTAEQTKLSGAGMLGREIYKNWKRVDNTRKGQPSDEYDLNAVDNNQYEIIGALAKEMYHLANPDMVTRKDVFEDSNPNEKSVKFELTPVGAARIRQARKDRPDAFANQEIEPTSEPRPFLDKFGGTGEGAKLRKGKTTSVVNQKQKQIEEAKRNMNSISHVVDPKRRKIMMQLGIQALKEIKQNGTSVLGDLFDIGPKKLEYFRGELAKKRVVDPETNYNPDQEYQKHVLKFIEAMNTASRYSGKNNHLDFAVQELQNRMHVEQTRFNPQGNKWLRFVTGGATPDTWTAHDGSAADLAFKEQMAVHFLGAKNLLPHKRIEAFNQDWNRKDSKLKQMAAIGGTINESMMNPQMDKQTYELFAQVNKDPNSGAINVPPQLGQVPPLNVPASLLNEATHEGIEGLSLIEAASELANYIKGGKIVSNLNVEFDGKTHGPASNMAQLGVERGAFRTGILRGQFENRNLGDIYIPKDGVIATHKFKPVASSLKQTATTRDKTGLTTAWEDYVISTGKGRADDNISGGFPAADYIDNDGTKVEVKGLSPKHIAGSGNFYMTKATMDNMINKIDNGMIDVVEVIGQKPIADGNVEVQVFGRIPAQEFKALITQDISNDSIAKRFGYAGKVENIVKQAGEIHKAGDLRDGMKDYMLSNGQQMIENVFGNTDLAQPMWAILNEAVKDRTNYLKKPPMTLGYGQLLKNLRGAVETTVFSGDRATQIRQIIDAARPQLKEKRNDRHNSEEAVVVEFLHDMLADAIDAELDPSVLEVGQTLRANNAIAMLSNEVMTIDNALGFKTYIGAKQKQFTGERVPLNITTADGGSVGDVYLTESKAAGSAVREGRVGGWGRGRVIPAVIQGIDGAWMNKTFTGDSWSQLKGHYMLPIMDAIKTNLSGARKVREHANKNWWNVIRDYSYVDEIMGKWAPEAVKNFRKKLMDMPQNQPIDITMNSEYRGFGFLLDPSSRNKKIPFENLRGFIGDTMDFRPRKTGESVIDYEKQKKDEAQKIAMKLVPNLWKKGVDQKPLDSLTPAQALNFFDRVINALNLQARNKSTVAKVDAKRKRLFAKAANTEKLQIDLG